MPVTYVSSTLRYSAPPDVAKQKHERRVAREKIRQLSRTQTAESIGFQFYCTTAEGGWTMPRYTARDIGLPTVADYWLGLAVAFVRFGMRKAVELARAAGIPPLAVASWAVAASRHIRRESRHNAWSIAP